ncbi:MAG: class I SAM-dependent methyltransferase [Ottowia sp.]|nr:class I SAM-dependent methyltransferase [Ottowia sp.]HPU09355.1 class I SAM-dependent methyltransferase [Ottowia sp.]
MQALLNAIATMPLPVDTCRIFHGRGGLYAGCEQWTLDVYPPVFVLTSFATTTDEQLATVGAALQARWQQIAPPDQAQSLNWVFQQRGQAARPQARSDTLLMAGNVPDPHIVTEGPALFLVRVLRGQNHGLFLDMAEGRRWVREFAADFRQSEGRGAKVLNLFAYTCAFSVAALQGGAAHVTNLDMARGALATGQQNHQLNGLAPQGASFLAHDLFNSWGKVTRGGPYDLVIADPPSYQKGSFVATKDYARLLRRLPDLLAPGGRALLCLNAPELPWAWLREQVDEHAPGLQLIERLAHPPAFADVDADRALKVGAYRAARRTD